MRRILLGLFALALAVSPALAGTQILSNIDTSLGVGGKDQHRLDSREMREATLFGYGNISAAGTVRVGLYWSISGANGTWRPCSNTAADSAYTFTYTGSGAFSVMLPITREYSSNGTSSWIRSPLGLSYPKLKIVVTNTSGSAILSSMIWLMGYQN